MEARQQGSNESMKQGRKDARTVVSPISRLGHLNLMILDMHQLLLRMYNYP
jgi:hypothetical protein